MKMIFSVTIVILQALMQHLNKNKILMPELKRCWPVITAWLNGSILNLFWIFFVFCFLCVFKHFYKGLCMYWRYEEEFCRVVKKPKLPQESEGMLWVLVVNVCACGPGQQHFPAGRGRSSSKMLFIKQLHSEWCESWDGQASTAFHKPCGPQEQKGLIFWGETEWMTEKSFYKKCVNKEQPFFRCL